MNRKYKLVVTLQTRNGLRQIMHLLSILQINMVIEFNGSFKKLIVASFCKSTLTVNGSRQEKISILKKLLCKHSACCVGSFLMGLLWLFSPVAFAESELPDELVFNYIKHPFVESVAIPLVRKSYASLGVSLKFVEMPSHREMIEVSSGNIDGSVIASQSLFERYDNIIAVQPAITESAFVLICNKLYPCDEQVLFDKDITVALTQATEKSLRHHYVDIQSKLYPINLLSAIPDLIRSGRFKYGVFVEQIDEVKTLESEDVRIYVLYKNPAYHVLSAKYRHAVPRISEALKHQLDQLNNAD